MDRYTMIVAVCGQATAVILIVSVLNAIVRYRRAGRTAGVPTDDLKRIESKLTDMQEALDTVAVEVERISEGQRFTTKLLAERGEIPMDVANGARAAGRAGPSR
jgi:hypothetical protein